MFKRLLSFNTIIFFCLILVNVIIYCKRDCGYAYKEIASYNQLYQHNEQNRIYKFTLIGNDSIEIQLFNEEGKRNWLVENQKQTVNYYGVNPVLKLAEGENKYTIQFVKNGQKSTIEIGLNFIPTQFYASSGRKKSAVVELYYANVPVGEYNLRSLGEWEQISKYTTQEEIDSAKKIIARDIKINSNDSSLVKIKKISGYILKNMENTEGVPGDSMDLISPLRQFEFAKQRKSKVWCGNLTEIFSFFAKSAGVITRSVNVEGQVGDVLKGFHSFNECYSEELNKWIFVDLTSKAVFIKNGKGEFLNAIDLYNLHLLDAGNLSVTTCRGDSFTTTGYDGDFEKFYNYFFNQNTSFAFYLKKQNDKEAYSISSKIKRYVSGSPTFVYYGGSQSVSNQKFYLKIFFLYGLALFSLYRIMALLIRRKFIFRKH